MAQNFGKTNSELERVNIGVRGRIIGLHEAGKTISEIAEQLGCHHTTVRKWVRR